MLLLRQVESVDLFSECVRRVWYMIGSLNVVIRRSVILLLDDDTLMSIVLTLIISSLLHSLWRRVETIKQVFYGILTKSRNTVFVTFKTFFIIIIC